MSGRGVYVVTGGNKGIGLEIVRKLKQTLGDKATVVLTSRDEENARHALNQLRDCGLEVEYALLDITKSESIESCVATLRERYGSIDVLVNNAGFAFKNAATNPFGEQARVSVDVNHYGTLNFTQTVRPLLKSGSRIVNVSSSAGSLSIVKSAELRERLIDDSLSLDGLNAIVEEFVELAGRGEHQAHGYPNTAYGMSKVALSAQTRILARTYERDGITVNACCPGWCRTDMAGPKATKSAAEGAETPVMLCLAPTEELGTGNFFSSEQKKPWY